MSAKSSKALIEELLAADLGDRHFSVWTLKEQGETIKRCGLASSQFKNRTEMTEILTILHETELPTDHFEVLTLIADLGLPPSGARSKQQFSFYLLSFMCEKLKFPPWDPVPVLSVVVPKPEILRDQVSSICSERISDINERPHAYIHRPNNQVAKLWNSRRGVWPEVLKTSAFGVFLQKVAAAYVKVINLVLGFSPKKQIVDLRCEMHEAMRTVDRHEGRKFFVEAWNQVVKNLPRAPTITSFAWSEWRWVLTWVFVGCKRAVAQCIREQFDTSEQVTDDTVYVGDEVSVRVVSACVCIS